MRKSKNLEVVLEILKNEVDGDVKAALQKIADDYSMTWMYQGEKKLFPRTGKSVETEMNEVYVIKGRKYDIRNVAEGDDVLMIELIESYPDPKTKKEYRTPLVLVLEMKDGKIRKGRHYCDPAVSRLYLTKELVEGGYNGTVSKKIID